MVRTGDYYIGLRERTEKARKANADFLVSIHADAFKHPSARQFGFCVIERGATSRLRAGWLIKKNESDLIGGVSLEDKRRPSGDDAAGFIHDRQTQFQR